MDYFENRISYPLEREYEAWIISQIENYLKKISIDFDVFAVSPADEKTWPADEAIDLEGKIIGLQFKRPALSAGHSANDFSRLFWDFSNPKGQLHLVVKHPEIFYCLPTFTNRDIREEALRHCLFWRPRDGSNMRAWYNNPSRRVKTKYSEIGDATRWGYFAEQLVSCKIGLLWVHNSFRNYMFHIQGMLAEACEGQIPRRMTIHFIIYYERRGSL
jgi:hypothetical protein